MPPQPWCCQTAGRAKATHAKFPDKPITIVIVIAGDDDRHQVMTHGTNAGRTKAVEAAKAVGGKAIFPTFAPGEVVYPDTLPAITPQAFRKHIQAAGELKAGGTDAELTYVPTQD